MPPPPTYKPRPKVPTYRPHPPDLEMEFDADPFDKRFVETPDGKLQDRHLTPLGCLINVYTFWRRLPDVPGRRTILAQCRITLGGYAPEVLDVVDGSG